jgi:hypothetical protein
VSESIPLPPTLADHPARVIAFRVNRRPVGEGTFFPETMPPDSFDHFVRMLAPGYEIVTKGRGHERSWRVGAVEIDRSDGFVTGKLGWHPRNPEVVPSWSDALMDWPPSVGVPRETLMPFAFDGTTRVLGVVHDKKTSARSIAAVFESILNENERELDQRTTEWSVEPILNSVEFIEWLDGLDVVESVAFVAKLPNPEPTAAFDDLTGRMDDAHGTEYAARMKTTREEGLQHIEEDPEFRQAIAMGKKGFAQLEGRGRRDGRPSVYKQKDKVASDAIPNVPADWQELRAMLKAIVRERLSRFLLDDEEAA